MKNIERWNFAQIYSSKEMIKLAVLLILCSSLGYIFIFKALYSVSIGLFLTISIVVVLTIRV